MCTDFAENHPQSLTDSSVLLPSGRSIRKSIANFAHHGSADMGIGSKGPPGFLFSPLVYKAGVTGIDIVGNVHCAICGNQNLAHREA